MRGAADSEATARKIRMAGSGARAQTVPIATAGIRRHVREPIRHRRA